MENYSVRINLLISGIGFGFIICFWIGYFTGSKNAEHRFLSEAVANGCVRVFIDDDGNEFVKWGGR
jgi:hypothetical protein